MKGLQAVLLFVVTHFAYCGNAGGEEMYFTRVNFLSLIIFGLATEKSHQSTTTGRRAGYERISNTALATADDGIEV